MADLTDDDDEDVGSTGSADIVESDVPERKFLSTSCWFCQKFCTHFLLLSFFSVAFAQRQPSICGRSPKRGPKIVS